MNTKEHDDDHNHERDTDYRGRHHNQDDHQGHHHHGHDPAHPHNHAVVGDIRIALWINVLFTVIELVGGLLTNSVAIIADAVHDLGDSATLAVALVLEKVSGRRRTKELTFGFRRFSILGALLTGLILIVGAITVLIHTIPRLIEPVAVDTTGMIVLSVLGVVMNALAAFRLSRTESMNARAAFLHLFEDVLGWIAVLFGALAIRFWQIYLIDPLLAIGINIFILTRAVPILLRALRVLLQYVPKDLSVEKVSEAIMAIESIDDVHDIHLWTLDGSYVLVSLHVVTDGATPLDDLEPLKARIRDVLKNLGVNHVTIELESPNTGCSECDL
ncbi:MAG: cation diffusion facilitator family transporter [Alkalispirochaeta sp.]